MPTLKIPDDQVPALSALASLGELDFELLVAAFSSTEPTVTQKQFATNTANKVKSIGKVEAMLILRMVLSLYHLKKTDNLSSSDIAESMSLAASAQLSQNPDFSKEKIQLLKDRLERILGFDTAVDLTVRARDVMTEYERVFCNARILSDIRPVFSDSPASASAAVIVHNLQIGFHQNGEHQELYFALDNTDIQKLKDVIVRAEQKTIGLKTIIEKSGTRLLDLS